MSPTNWQRRPYNDRMTQAQLDRARRERLAAEAELAAFKARILTRAEVEALLCLKP